MDFLSNFSNASTAASKAGMAFSRSRVASSAKIFVSLASFSMRIESASTCACCASALDLSAVITFRSSSHSLALTSQIFCFSSKSTLISATCTLASSSFDKPLRSLSAAAPNSFCLSFNIFM
eukprot:Skav230097  [mRNA]  locus=scaffold283:26682:29688:+ [translate_table: standard]